MKRQSGRLTLALLFAPVFALAHSLDASAETVAQTVQAWGLIGPCSPDCSLRPDRNRGTVLDYEIVGDERVMHRRNFGDSSDESEVVTAEVSGDGILNLRVFFPSLKQTREYGLMMQSDGTMRAIYNRDQTQAYSIKNGKFTADGSTTPPQHKCK